jgi:excisionase family DNA binding protein
VSNIEKLLYSQKEAAFMLSLSLRSIEHMISKQQIQVRKIGGRRLIPRSELFRIASKDHTELIAS